MVFDHFHTDQTCDFHVFSYFKIVLKSNTSGLGVDNTTEVVQWFQQLHPQMVQQWDSYLNSNGNCFK
jgi:hypothetical protein